MNIFYAETKNRKMKKKKICVVTRQIKQKQVPVECTSSVDHSTLANVVDGVVRAISDTRGDG